MSQETPNPSNHSTSADHTTVGDISNAEGVAIGTNASVNIQKTIETQAYIERQVIVQGVEITDLEQLPPEEGDPPYKGLTHFNEEDANWFFGRESATAVLINHLHNRSFLAVVGASGSGKSSLVRAGVVPVMKRNNSLPDGTEPPLGEWEVFTLTPTAHPLVKLAVTLFPDDYAQQAILKEQSAQDPKTLRNMLIPKIEPGHKILLFVDQFEEIFTLCEKEEERQVFIDNLLSLVEDNNEFKVIITLRADFYAECLRYEGLRQVLKTSQEPLGAMTSQELAAAILEPAAKGNWQFQAGLIEEIIEEVGEEPGALPLLSHALLETWHRRRGRVLTLSGYREAGKVQGAIAQTAEATYKELSPEDQKAAQRIFLRLTELGEGTQDTRRRVQQEDLGETNEIQGTANKLADARLITKSQDGVDVAHEALIREWPRLREWLNADRESHLILRRLTNAALTWEEEDKDPSFLYTGLRLVEAEQWAENNEEELIQREREFLTESIEAERKRKRNQRALQIGGAVLLAMLIMLGIGIVSTNEQRNVAIEARETADAEKVISDVNAARANEESTKAYQAQETADAEKLIADENAARANEESTRAFEAQETAVAAEATAQIDATKANENARKADEEARIAAVNEALAQEEATRAYYAEATADANALQAVDLAQVRLARSDDLINVVSSVDDALATQEAYLVTNSTDEVQLEQVQNVRSSLNTVFAQNMQTGLNIDPSVGDLPDGEVLEGMDWVRLVFKLDSVYYGDIEAALNAYEPIVQTYALQGISILFVLNQETFWGNAPWNGTEEDWDVYAKDMASKAQSIAKEVSMRYSRYGSLIAYEIWDEVDYQPPNASGIFIPPKVYAKILDQTANAIRTVSPEVKIIYGSLISDPQSGVSYIQQVQEELDGELPVDAIGLKPYGRANSNIFGNNGGLDEVFDSYQATFPDIPLWVTEIGMPSNSPIGSEYYSDISDYMLDVYSHIGTEYAREVPVVIWFAWSDQMQNAGIVDDHGEPKEYIYDAFLDVQSGAIFEELEE